MQKSFRNPLYFDIYVLNFCLISGVCLFRLIPEVMYAIPQVRGYGVGGICIGLWHNALSSYKMTERRMKKSPSVC
jgi:hypothetical protein